MHCTGGEEEREEMERGRETVCGVSWAERGRGRVEKLTDKQRVREQSGDTKRQMQRG